MGRFIYKKLKIGDTFTDNGFLSTTRDPFYSPGIDGDFGLILLKINIPKNKKGVGLFLENFSMFPQEEEFLLGAGSKFKLISKDDKFKYYHTNKQFEKKLKKYEFTYIGSNNVNNINQISNSKIPNINIDKLNLIGKDRFALFKLFLELCDNMGQFTFNKKIFISQYFDSESSYQDFYYNSTHNGFIIYHYDNGYPLLSLEFGDIFVVNFTRTYNYYDTGKNLKDIDNMLDIISYFGRIFKYKNARIYSKYVLTLPNLKIIIKTKMIKY